jgi:hypothetical protein
MANMDTVSLLTAYRTVAAAFLLVPVAAMFFTTIALWFIDRFPQNLSHSSKSFHF